MKKIYILLSAAVVLTSSCSKFLEESSQDLVRPVTVEHYKELLQGEAYYKEFYKVGWFVDMMTDNINALDLQYPTTVVRAMDEYGRNAYKWAQDLEDPATGTFEDTFFKLMYKNILPANSVLQDMDVIEGTEQDKNVLKGQAYFTRAYGYFVLANLYAQAYNEAEETDLCVPIILNANPTLKGYNRATIKEVWDLISSDIEASVEALATDKVNRSVYEINYKAALLLASRVFLFKEDYDKAIFYGEKYLSLNPNLLNISAYTGVPNTGGASKGEKAFLYFGTNPEIVFTFGTLTSTTALGGYVYYANESVGPTSAKVAYTVSKNVPSALLDTYETNDLRLKTWFSASSGSVGSLGSKPYSASMKVNYTDLCRTSQYMRSGEVYLNLAEAYARKDAGISDTALELLNTLRQKRIKSYVPKKKADFISKEQFVEFVWQERRRELCFEEFHRWWDLRRIGQPELQHVYLDQKYTLNKNDPAYILNFPKVERDFNAELVNNQRPERLPN